jgi:hypothetical protein
LKDPSGKCSIKLIALKNRTIPLILEAGI